MFKGLFPGPAHNVYPLTKSAPLLPLSGTALTLHKLSNNACMYSICGLKAVSLKYSVDLWGLPYVYHTVSIC